MTAQKSESPRGQESAPTPAEPSIASRAAVGFALVWFVTALAIAGSAMIARDAERALEATLAGYADDLLHASRAQVAAERMVAVGRGYLLTREPERLVLAKTAGDGLTEALRALERESLDTGDRDLLRQVERSAQEYRSLLEGTLEAASRGEQRAALVEALQESLIPARESLDARLEQLVEHKERLQASARLRATNAATRSVRVTIGLGSLALALSAFLAGTFTSRLAQASRREQAHAEKAERALAARDELLRVVAHDLRNPLAAISLRASVIAHAGGSDMSARSAVAIEGIARRMAHLIESLVDAAGVEAGRLAIRPEWFAVDGLVRDALETFEPAAHEKGIRLAGMVMPSDLFVCADRERLLQVLSNLIGNALKFTPERGAVKIAVTGGDDQASFEVSDTGAGIAEPNLARVFDRYWKSDARGTRGVGLGLYIAKGIVEAHGGRISVESTAGAGSSFHFEVPNQPLREGEPLTRPPLGRPRKGALSRASST